MTSKTSLRKRRRPRASTGKTTKIAVDFPTALFEEAERTARELSMNRSVLIRSAVEQYLRGRQREELERQIAESLSANAELERELVNEFAGVDAEGFDA